MRKINWNNGTVHLETIEDDRGKLCALEDFPFEVKRVFFIGDASKNTIRGEHAHFKEEQVIVCTGGCLQIMLYDGVGDTKTYLLKFGDAVYVPRLMWSNINFIEPFSIMLVLSSTLYDERDYIRELRHFETVKRGINFIFPRKDLGI